MEVATRRSWKERLSGLFFKEPKAFTSRRDVNWSGIKKVSIGVVLVAVIGLLLMPSPTPEQTTFHEKAEPGSVDAAKAPESNPTNETLAQLQASRANAASVPSSLDYLYRANGGGPASGGGNSGADRSATMILVRGGQDSKAQLPPGSRIAVRLTERVIIASQSMPVMGIVAREVVHEDSLAIPEGAKVLGDVSFDDSTERAQITWRSIIFPDGRERPLSAIGVGGDGQLGVEGKIHSDALKNTIGQTITRFIGAYAEGSMSRGQMGAAEGGHENGVRNAVAETAKDRANAWAEDMRKEKKWIELDRGAESLAVLNQPFIFRDPGGTHGR
jgi:type IV secretory pathway VirB10-like protein